MSGGKLLPEIDEHLESFQVCMLELQILFFKQFCLPLYFASLLNNSTKTFTFDRRMSGSMGFTM